ncbi:ribosomal protein S18-alanine N-acetyltransferase [Dermacoccaceae bacterium W4C1]
MAWPDIPALAELERAAFGSEAWNEQTWWAELAQRPRRAYWVALGDAGQILGYAGLDLGRDVADVMTIAVAPDAQGSGLGRRLLALLIEQAGASGAESLMLEVRADNARARDLYERNDFEVLTVRRGYYPGGGDALVMRRLLR